ncbi:SDR family oxidoreductase [Alphaproteobacteria bacterium]|nr:SDR family oxidoreductase [Alphaproteobacteria bacterium]
MALNEIFSLKGKVVVITGAAGFLGCMHAEAVAAYGGTPILLDLSFEQVDKIAKELVHKFDCRAVGFAVDITNECQIQANLIDIMDQFGRIDALVNNAANNPQVSGDSKSALTRLENFSLQQWSDDLSVGLTGAFLCAKIYGHQISKNPSGGVIVNISSDLGLIAPDQRLYANEGKNSGNVVKPVTYSVVKTGLLGLTRYLATYWADQNVRCNAICPGGVKDKQPEDFLDKVSFRIPMGRLAQQNEYQGTLIWMLSEASSYLTGAIVPVDGGRTVW